MADSRRLSPVPDHPVYAAPTLAQCERWAAEKSLTVEQAATEILTRRADVIAAEREDAYTFGYVPLIWRVAWALMGYEFRVEGFEDEVKARFGDDWTVRRWNAAMRKCLGFDRVVKVLCLLGGQRQGKTEFSARTEVEVIREIEGGVFFDFHTTKDRSVADHQKQCFNYLPLEWKRVKRTAGEYVKFTEHGGFSGQSFNTPSGGGGFFRTARQDRDTALQGTEGDYYAFDERIPVDWITETMARKSTRDARVVVLFTPIWGRTPTVQLFVDGAVTTRESIAYCLPKDGGGVDRARQLGLSDEQYAEHLDATATGRPPCVARSEPEDCHAWIEQAGLGGDRGRKCWRPFGFGQAQLAPAYGREFAMMPRVMRCVNPEQAVLFFHAGDGQYGNPDKVIHDALVFNDVNRVKIRVYGFPNEGSAAAQFSNFEVGVHVVPDESVPKEGTNYHFIDPASNRPWAMGWWRACKDLRNFAWMEWPGSGYVPGAGILGPWAVSSGRKCKNVEGYNDGDPGEGQQPVRFGHLRYKFEIARLEEWAEWRTWCDQAEGDDTLPDDELLTAWQDDGNAKYPVHMRYIDSRSATTPKTDNDRQTDLVSELREIGLRVDFAPGHEVTSQVDAINNALYFERDEKTDLIIKMPKLYVAASCKNTIFCWQTWKNAEGQKGATKDFCDHARWYYGRECGYVEAVRVTPTQTAARMPGEGFVKYLDRTQRGNARWGNGRSSWGRKAR